MDRPALIEPPAPGASRSARDGPSRVAVGRVDRPFRGSEWVRLPRPGVGWFVRSGWESALIGPEGLRLEEWRAQGRLTVVKSGPQRVVYRAELPEGVVYVKHYKVPSWREMLRQWFRRGKGRNEAKRAGRLRAIGVATIEPIALGEQRRGKFLFENYLITPEVPGTRPLDVFLESVLPSLPEPRRGAIRRGLARNVAELTARLHDAGFVHQDFHPGNLLVRVGPGDAISTAIIDLDALRRKRRVDWRAAASNLALLNHYFWLRADRADRRRFLRDYLNARTPTTPAPDPKPLARRVESATRAWAERLWTRWGRRCHGSNKYFRAVRAAGVRGVASQRLDGPEVHALLADPDGPFRDPATKVLKSSRTTLVAEITLRVDGQPSPVIYKKFHSKKRLDPLLTLIRPTRGWRAWQAGCHISSRGLPTPPNLACLERIGGRGLDRLPRESYLATLRAVPAITLEHYALRILPALDSESRRLATRRMARALGRLIRALHERSVSQRDLKAANILVEGDPLAAEPKLSLIDLVGVEVHHPLPNGRRVQNLARLALSLIRPGGPTRTDALRFLRAYQPTPGPGWKGLWHSVERRGLLKRLQNQRRNRPLS